MSNACVDGIHNRVRGRSKVSDPQRVSVLVQADCLHIDARQEDVNSPRITRSGAARITEVVVVVNLVQSRVQVVIAVDVRWISHVINENEAYRKVKNPITATGTTHRVKECFG